MTGARRPEVAASAVARHDDQILLVRRGPGPAGGKWAVPGGRVHFGEDLREAVVREVAEETGLECTVERFLGWSEQIDAEHHFVILDFLVVVLDPEREPEAGDDAAEAVWWPVGELDQLELVPGLFEFLDEVGALET